MILRTDNTQSNSTVQGRIPSTELPVRTVLDTVQYGTCIGSYKEYYEVLLVPAGTGTCILYTYVPDM